MATSQYSYSKLLGGFLRKHRDLQLADPPTTESVLCGMYQRGKRAWPGIDVDPEDYGCHVGGVWHPSATPLPDLLRLNAEDLYFICACERGVPAALTILGRILQEHLSKHVRGLGLSSEQLLELRQTLWIKLLGDPPDIPGCIQEYAGTGSFEAFLRVVMVRDALYVLRKEARSREVPQEQSEVQDAEDFELKYIKACYREPVKQALSATLEQLSREDRMLLKLYYIERFSIDRLAHVFEIHRSTAARRIQQLQAAIQREFLARVQDHFRVDEVEARDLLAIVQSQLDISLQRLLETSATT